MEIVSLKMDFVFREVMEDPQVRKYFLCDVLDISVEEIEETRLGNTFLRRRWRYQKQGILDVKIILKDKTRINIELQLRRQKFWEKRSLYYLSKMYSDVLFVGEDYSKLRRCVSINILDYNLTDKEEYHSVYRMRDCQGNDYSDLLELHTIELQKKLCKDSRLDDWIRLFNCENEEDLNMIKTRNIGIQRAKQILREISLPETVREIIEDQRKRKMDRRAEDAYVFDQGKEQGSEIGQERMARLTKLLLADKRQKDLELALDDKDYREKLYREYRI